MFVQDWTQEFKEKYRVLPQREKIKLWICVA